MRLLCTLAPITEAVIGPRVGRDAAGGLAFSLRRSTQHAGGLWLLQGLRKLLKGEYPVPGAPSS